MKVLLVSNMYAYPGNWDKLDALAREVELGVVMPSSWRTTELHPVKEVPPQPPGSAWRQYRVDALFQFQGNPFRYFYRPGQLAEALDEFRPDLVHVEQEPESLSLTQLSLMKSRYKYRLIFVAWENINPLRLGWPLRTLNFKLADAAIAGNQAADERCRRLGFDKRTEVIPQYGFEVATGGRAQRVARAPFVIGYAGRLVQEKGVLTLVEAVRRIPGAEVQMAGDGPLAEALRSTPQVHVLGTLPRGELAAFWDAIDVLVLPSLTTRKWAEQFGRVLAEAMAAGVPVVGSSSGAIPEVIGDAGLVFPEGDADALAAALRSLAASQGLRDDLSRKGKQRVRACYSNEVIMGRTVAFYDEVARADSGRP